MSALLHNFKISKIYALFLEFAHKFLIEKRFENYFPPDLFNDTEVKNRFGLLSVPDRPRQF